MTSDLILKRGHHAMRCSGILPVREGGEELGTSAVDDVNQSSSLYCAICIFVASWDKREYVHECICCVGASVWLCVRKK
eukprot:scaffold3399_cov79-Skeletonema_dohrnii-CCMP3373.AAC.2